MGRMGASRRAETHQLGPRSDAAAAQRCRPRRSRIATPLLALLAAVVVSAFALSAGTPTAHAFTPPQCKLTHNVSEEQFNEWEFFPLGAEPETKHLWGPEGLGRGHWVHCEGSSPDPAFECKPIGSGSCDREPWNVEVKGTEPVLVEFQIGNRVNEDSSTSCAHHEGEECGYESATFAEVAPDHRRHGPRHREHWGHGAKLASLHRVHTECSDPVECATGNLVESQTDLTVGGRGVPLTFTRTYNSQEAAEGGSAGALGAGWSYSFGQHLEFSNYTESFGGGSGFGGGLRAHRRRAALIDNTTTVVEADGSRVTFEDRVGPGELIAPRWVQAKLVLEADGNYLYTLPDQEKLRFNSSGTLLSIADRFNNTDTLSYAGGHLITVKDSSNRELTFSYLKTGSGAELIKSVTDPMGHTVEYSYGSGEGALDLTGVTEPGEATKRWQFKYESGGLLKEMTDGRNNTTTIKYYAEYDRVHEEIDPMGRVTRFEYEQIGEEPFEGASNVVAETRAEEESMSEATGEEEAAWQRDLHEASEPPLPPPPEYITIIKHEPEKPETEEVTREVFDSEYNLKQITQGYGTLEEASTFYAYNEADEPTTITEPDEHETKYEYEDGNLIKESDKLGDTTEWEYDPLHDVKMIKTPDGEVTRIKRNETTGAAEKVTRETAHEGEEVTKYTYNTEHGEVESMTDPRNNTWTYKYDPYGDLTSETDPEEDVRTFAYNEDSQEISTTSPRGNVREGEPVRYTTTIQRDEQGRPTLVTEPPIGYFEEAYLPSSKTHVEVPSGLAVDSVNHHVFVSDSWNNRVEELSETGERIAEIGHGDFNYPNQLALDSEGNLWVANGGDHDVVEFNSEGHYVRSITGKGAEAELDCPSGVAIGPGGNLWVLDECKDRVVEIDPATEEAVMPAIGKRGEGPKEFEYPEGLALAVSGGTCDVWVSDFANSRLQEFKCSNGEFVREVGSRGSGPEKLYNPDGVAIGSEGNVFVSDWFNMRLDVYSPEGKFIETIGYTSPGEGQIELPGQSVGVPDGQMWVTDRSLGRIERWGPYSSKTGYAYDEDGNLKTVEDPDGHTTRYEYDKDDELDEVIEPNGETQKTTYDSQGQVKTQTDGNEHTTTYEHNVLEQVKKVIDPKGRETKLAYYDDGDIRRVTNPEGHSTCYTYDKANRLTDMTYYSESACLTPNTEPSVKYEYDSDGHLKEMVDGTGTSVYGYDELGRLKESTDGHHDKVVYSYNADNEPERITYPNEKAVSRSYDKDGRLSTVKDWLEHETTFKYDPDSDLSKIIFPVSTGDEDLYAYNEADEMTEASMKKESGVLASLTYARDHEGNVTQAVTVGLPEAGTAKYEYDENGRLRAVIQGEHKTEYEYDRANNLTKIGSTEQSFDPADQLKESGGNKYSYNEEGDRTEATPPTGAPTEYEYNQANELTSVSRAEGPSIGDSYTYNGEGLRASEKISGSSRYLTWDEAESVPSLLSDGERSYVYGPEGLPIEQVSTGGTVTYLHHDQQASTRLLTNSSGTVVGKCSYAAYGTPTCEGSVTTPLEYDGQYTNSETGLQYLRARNYDPSTGQFTSVDPLDATTEAPYTYALDNPVNGSDPSGLCNANPFSGSFWTKGNCLSEHPGQAVEGAAIGVCIVATTGVCLTAAATAYAFNTEQNITSPCGFSWRAQAVITGTALLGAAPALNLEVPQVLGWTGEAPAGVNAFLAGPGAVITVLEKNIQRELLRAR